MQGLGLLAVLLTAAYHNFFAQVFCGTLARIAQFSDIMRDSKQQIDQACIPHRVTFRLGNQQCRHAIAVVVLGQSRYIGSL